MSEIDTIEAPPKSLISRRTLIKFTALVKQPEFTQMRKIKQLGCTDYVYSTAIGNRFQHSVATALKNKISGP